MWVKWSDSFFPCIIPRYDGVGGGGGGGYRAVDAVKNVLDLRWFNCSSLVFEQYSQHWGSYTLAEKWKQEHHHNGNDSYSNNNNEPPKQKITHLPMDILYDKQKGLDEDITQLNEYIPFDVGSAIEYQWW